MIEATIARLEGVPALNLVAGSVDYESAAATAPRVMPAAFVLPLREVPKENALGDAVAQMVTASYTVALAVSNKADAGGRAAMVDLTAVRREVRKQLLGWVPEDGATPYEYAGGALLGFKNGVLWWQDVFATEFLIKA